MTRRPSGGPAICRSAPGRFRGRGLRRRALRAPSRLSSVGTAMNKGLALRLLSILLFTGMVFAACSSNPTSTGDNGPGNPDGSVPSLDATTGGGHDGAVNGSDDAGGGFDAGAPCDPGTTQCSGNAVQICS